jgi:hypothetical protein
VEDFTWLNEVREIRHSIDPPHPLVVKQVDLLATTTTQRSFPEKHPHCEIGFNFEGRSSQLIGMGPTEHMRS